ncbi:hypothetical protein SAMN05414139_06919 [Burkholderia sp. D7]|nr:hypothetical protein SAMN05414139_06919 [Burkholderia sp. D7]
MIHCLRHQLYHRAVILPALALGQLMAEHDFNMGQVAVVFLMQGLLHAWHAGTFCRHRNRGFLRWKE